MKATENAPIAESVPAVLSGGDTVVPAGQEKIADLFDVSIPKVGAYRTEDHRYYWNRKGPFPSVTSVLNVMDKPAIVTWAKRVVADTAVRNWEEVGSKIQKESPDAASKWLQSLPDYQRDAAAKLGTSIHLLAEMEGRGDTFQVSEEEAPYLTAFQLFLAFLTEHQGTIVSSEKMVWSEDGYAGTYDLIVRFECLDDSDRHDGEECDCEYAGLWLIDVKTTRTGPYPEWALQLIAYGTADWIIVPDNPMGFPMPIVQRYGVLHLRPDLYTDTGWRLIEYPLIDSDKMAFLGALELYRWKEGKRYTKSKLLNPEAQKG